jgi:hypothetical protein
MFEPHRKEAIGKKRQKIGKLGGTAGAAADEVVNEVARESYEGLNGDRSPPGSGSAAVAHLDADAESYGDSRWWCYRPRCIGASNPRTKWGY